MFVCVSGVWAQKKKGTHQPLSRGVSMGSKQTSQGQQPFLAGICAQSTRKKESSTLFQCGFSHDPCSGFGIEMLSLGSA